MVWTAFNSAGRRRTGGHGRLTYLYLIMMTMMMVVVVDCCVMMKAKKFALPFTIIIINNKTASSAYVAKFVGKEEHDEEV